MKKMKTFDDTELIEQVKRFPLIYDRCDKDYKLRKNKSNAFSIIAEILNSQTSIVQSRWVVLRNRFATELRYLKNKAPGEAAPTWRFFENLKFLEPHIQTRITKEPPSSSEGNESETTSSPFFKLTEIEVESENNQEVSETNQITVNEEEPREEHSEIGNTEVPSISSLREEVETLELEKSRNSSYSSKRKKRDESGVGIALLTALMKVNKCVNRQEPLTPPEDEDALFGKLVGQYLKKVTGTRNKLELKRKILSAFLDAGCI